MRDRKPGGRKWVRHILNVSGENHSLCGNPPGLHRTWPYGHNHTTNPSKATCPECIYLAKLEHDSKLMRP